MTNSTSASNHNIDRRRSPKSPQGRGRIRPKQLQRLQVLWHLWTKNLDLSREADQQLRHYYVAAFSGGRALETRDLTEGDAIQVIRWLTKLVWMAEAPNNYVAGTAGRHGYPEQRLVRPTYMAWHALWRCAAGPGMQRQDLESFIRRHYGGAGLGGLADLRTMADLNRVFWGLKEILRRRKHSQRLTEENKRAA